MKPFNRSENEKLFDTYRNLCMTCKGASREETKLRIALEAKFHRLFDLLDNVSDMVGV
jgi:hypothetical protein